MKRTLTITCTLLAVVLMLAGSARAEISIEYLGSFDMAAAGFDETQIAFVPANSTRVSGAPNIGYDTLVSWSDGLNWGRMVKEYRIPDVGDLAKTTSDAIPQVGAVSTSDGGTSISDAANIAGITVFEDKVWNLQRWSNNPSFAGALTPGYNGAGLPAGYVAQTLPDPTADDYAVDGGGFASKRDDTLAYMTFPFQGTRVRLHTATRDGGGWDTQNEFYFDTTGVNENQWPLEYAVLEGKGYYVLYNANDSGGHVNAAKLLLYDSTDFKNQGGGDADGKLATAPTLTLDIDALIGGGVGWLDDNSYLTDLAYDPTTNRLYATERHSYGTDAQRQIARVHVFQVPEPATMGLLGLGFAGMAALRRRRRRS